MNERILSFIRPYNKKVATRLADNKLLTKKTFQTAGLPVPRLYAVIKNHKELNQFNWVKLPNSFVLKPNAGLKGEGILIIFGRKKKTGNWVKADGAEITIDDLKQHIENILDGNYSLAETPDIAFFEQRVKNAPFIKPYCFRGLPDIRVIVFNKIPVMAMLRLPTKESQGKANLSMGGIGLGIDISSGITTYAVQRNSLIETLPDSRLALSGIKIPFWDDILLLAIKAQIVSKIGFLGVDVAIDKEEGPMILEINARPGLSIQIANLAPLLDRLRRVEGLKVPTAEKGKRIAQEIFGGTVEQEIEEVSGKKVVGAEEEVIIFDSSGREFKTLAKIDTGAFRTALCQNLAEKLHLTEILKTKKVKSALGAAERSIIPLTFLLKRERIQTEAFIADRSELKYEMIIGRKDLKKFLVDPAKKMIKNV